MYIAFFRHIPAHYPRRADLDLVEIAFRVSRKICSEYSVQLHCRMHVDILRSLRHGIYLKIYVAQIFVKLRQNKLQRGLDSVNVYRRKALPRNTPRRAELAAEHELYKLSEHAVLCAEYVLKRADRNVRFADYLTDGGVVIPLPEKQPDAGGKYSVFRFDTAFSQRHYFTSCQFIGMHTKYNIYLAFWQVVLLILSVFFTLTQRKKHVGHKV